MRQALVAFSEKTPSWNESRNWLAIEQVASQDTKGVTCWRQRQQDEHNQQHDSSQDQPGRWTTPPHLGVVGVQDASAASHDGAFIQLDDPRGKATVDAVVPADGGPPE